MLLLVQIPTDLPSLSTSGSPADDGSLVWEHLLHLCSKLEPLPAITLRMEGGKAVVVRGLIYLEIARALHKPTVRAVIASPQDSPEARAFLADGNVQRLDWEELSKLERADPDPAGWQVFFFERALALEEKQDFAARVVALFGATGLIEDIHFDDESKMAEFQARVPVDNHEWAARHLTTFAEFSRERVQIVSFQGRRFPR